MNVPTIPPTIPPIAPPDKPLDPDEVSVGGEERFPDVFEALGLELIIVEEEDAIFDGTTGGMVKIGTDVVVGTVVAPEAGAPVLIEVEVVTNENVNEGIAVTPQSSPT
jgi:hypothetical protein